MSSFCAALAVAVVLFHLNQLKTMVAGCMAVRAELCDEG